MKFTHLIALGLASLATVLPAEAKLRMMELAIEATSRMLVLPAQAGGDLSVQPCPTCAAKQIRTTAATLFQVGDEEVSLGEMAQILRDNPGIALTVMTDMKSTVVTRVRVQGTPVRSRSR
jgi:hypothetical protein